MPCFTSRIEIKSFQNERNYINLYLIDLSFHVRIVIILLLFSFGFGYETSEPKHGYFRK